MKNEASTLSAERAETKLFRYFKEEIKLYSVLRTSNRLFRIFEGYDLAVAHAIYLSKLEDSYFYVRLSGKIFV